MCSKKVSINLSVRAAQQLWRLTGLSVMAGAKAVFMMKGAFWYFNQKEGLIPRSLLRNKLFQDMEEVIY